MPSFDVAILREALARAHRQAPEHGALLDRAASIVALRRIQRTAGGHLVESKREPDRYYLVSQDPMGVRCICQDYRQRGGLLCKHILAVRLLALCERLAAQREPIPFPAPTLDPDAPIPFAITPQGAAYLAARRAPTDEPTPAA